MAHLNYVHAAGTSSGSDVNYKELLSGKLHSHGWIGKWEALPEPTSYIGRTTLWVSNIILGFKIKSLEQIIIADQVSS